MKLLFDYLRVLAFAIALAFAGTQTASAQATPLASSEKELLEYLKDCPPGHPCRGRVTIPDQKSRVLVQDGRAWQERMEGPVKTWGAWFLLGVPVLLALFY